MSKPLLLGTPEHKPGYALVRLPQSRIMHKSDPPWARIPTFHGKNPPARNFSHGGDAHGMDLSWGRAEIQNCPATTPKGASTREIQVNFLKMLDYCLSITSVAVMPQTSQVGGWGEPRLPVSAWKESRRRKPHPMAANFRDKNCVSGCCRVLELLRWE